MFISELYDLEVPLRYLLHLAIPTPDNTYYKPYIYVNHNGLNHVIVYNESKSGEAVIEIGMTNACELTVQSPNKTPLISSNFDVLSTHAYNSIIYSYELLSSRIIHLLVEWAHKLLRGTEWRFNAEISDGLSVYKDTNEISVEVCVVRYSHLYDVNSTYIDDDHLMRLVYARVHRKFTLMDVDGTEIFTCGAALMDCSKIQINELETLLYMQGHPLLPM